MRFVTHHRYKELALCGEQLNIPYGTELETEGESLVTAEGKAVCYTTSENAKKHFAQNDDGRGLERGTLTWAIAYSQRQKKSKADGAFYRFSDEEREMLWRRCGTSCGRTWTLSSSTRHFSQPRRRSCKSWRTR